MALLSDMNVGDIVKINEDGSPVNFIIVHKGKPSSLYDASCNGVWLLRETTHSVREWEYYNENDYEHSNIDDWLNAETYKDG